MLKLRLTAILLGIVAFSSIGLGQVKVAFRENSTPQIFPLAELKEGMHGTARTVFAGTKPEEFQVEILGVIPNWIGPKQDMIVGRLSGPLAERTFVFAGMSGSPVYVDGRLVGAISYSFPFAKEPICGITPIEQMISTTVTGPGTVEPRAARAFDLADLAADKWRPALTRIKEGTLASGFSTSSPLMAIAGQTFRPIATPIAVTGLSQQTIDMFADDFTKAGLLAVAASGGGSSSLEPMKQPTETTLRGGDSVVVHLARGDIQIAAAGTVTLRDGNKIYAFGHPFFSLGSTNLPMSESHVVTVVPNANNSFKLAVPDSMVGAMTQDRATGIYGQLGEEPKMIPVRVRLTTSRGRVEETNFESVVDETFTSLIVNAGIGNILNAHERNIGEATIELTGEIKIKGQEPVRIQRRFAGMQAVPLASAAPAVPIGALLHGNFSGLEITGVDLEMKAVDGSRTATLDRISVDRNQVRPGEKLEATAFIRNEAGVITTQAISITVPKDASPGMVNLQVGDGSAVQQNSAITQFTPKNAAQLISTLNHLKRSDKLYAMLTRTSAGAIIGSSEMPNLPPSVLATLNNDRASGGSKPAVQTIITEMQLPSSDYIVGGSQTLQIEIVKD